MAGAQVLVVFLAVSSWFLLARPAAAASASAKRKEEPVQRAPGTQPGLCCQRPRGLTGTFATEKSTRRLQLCSLLGLEKDVTALRIEENSCASLE